MPQKPYKLIVVVIYLLVLLVVPLSKADWVGAQTVNATLVFSPNVGTYRAAVGVTFDIDILVNTGNQNVNSVTAIITYDSANFSVTVLDCNDATKPSVFYIGGTCQEAEKSVNSTTGIIRITRGVLYTSSPNYINTASGRFATLRITGLADTVPTGNNFTFDFAVGNADKSNVFLLNPLGYPILNTVTNGRYTLDGTAPANVTNLTATPAKGQITLSWTNPASDFAAVRILRKTGSYPTSLTDGTVVYESNGTSYIDTGLTNGTTYYYKAYSRDALFNYSSGAQISAIPTDNTAPAQINTLSATNLTGTIALKTVVLNWTAVGDDGMTGTAASYDIRYSTAAITSANYSSATQVSGEPTPKASGGAETMSISPLSGNTTYYFAIKAVDAAGNTSPLSNIPSVTTYKRSDINNTGAVNGQDFSILLGWWLDTTKSPADINQSGEVGGQDFSIMMGEWTG